MSAVRCVGGAEERLFGPGSHVKKDVDYTDSLT